MSDKKWIITYNEQGEPIRWTPWEQYIALKFISNVFDRTNVSPMIWGTTKIEDKEQIWEIAQEEYKKYEDELPISYLNNYKP